jgi:hypothetical protein
MQHNLANASKTIEINHSTESIKSSIYAITGIDKFTYQMKSANDSFLTYNIWVPNLRRGAFLDITLTKLEDNKTKITIDSKGSPQSGATSGDLEGVINNFLQLLARSLDGESIGSTELKKTAGSVSSCMVILIGLLAIGGFIGYSIIHLI